MATNTCHWETPPDSPLCFREHAEVHIWGVSLEQPQTRLTPLQAVLAPQERKRAERFVFEQHKRRFIVSQGSLRQILARYLQQAP
jgi:4'-phosphopantetheinyl transferase